jgi:succinoglycan biosynthesis transport protein ExoP
MELKNYLYILIRWIWLLLLCTLLGTGGGYVFSRLEEPAYQASTKILISKDLSDQNSQFAAMNNQQLIDTYVQLLTSTSVIDEASRRLNYEIYLKELGSVQQVQTTNVIEIIMVDGDPQRAAAIANVLVEVLIDQNNQASGYASTEENIKKKITEVEGQITTLQTQFNQISDEKLQSQLKQINDQITPVQDEILKLNTEISPLAYLTRITPEQRNQLVKKETQLAQLQSRLAQYQQILISLELVGKPALNSSDLGGDLRLQLLQSTLDYYQKTYLDLLDNLQAVQLAHLRNTPTIDQIEKAIPPANPVRPQRSVYIVLGGVIGLMLAIGMIFIIEYLDNTLKTPQDVQQALGVPVLGNIANMQPASKTEKGLPVEWQLHSQTSEALYTLRTNLEFAVAHHPLKTLLLLSVNESGKGKTSMAVDLAVSYAQSGSRVVLLDADMRNPGIHSYFGLANKNGFSDLLADDLKTDAACKKVEGLDGITVITGGNASPATDGLLKPDKIVQILDELKRRSDVIIIDAPSISVADSWVLASKVDGVLLVIQPRVTHRAFALKSLEQLNLAGATIMGVVLYHIPHNLASYYGSIRHNRRFF